MIFIDNLLEKAIETRNLEDVNDLLEILTNYKTVFIAEEEVQLFSDELLTKFNDELLVIKFLKILFEKKGIIIKKFLYDMYKNLKKKVDELDNEEDAKTATKEQLDYIELLRKLQIAISKEFLTTSKFEEHFDSFRERIKKINEQKKLEIVNEEKKLEIIDENKEKVWPLEDIYQDLLTDDKISKLIKKDGLEIVKNQIIEDIANASGISSMKKNNVIHIINNFHSAKDLIFYLSNSMLDSSSNLGTNRGSLQYNSHRKI